MTYAQPMADPTSIVGRRIGAWFLDLLIYLVIAVLLSLAGGGAGAETRTFDNSSQATSFCDGWNQTHQGFCFNTSSGSETTVTTYETGALSSAWLPLHFALYVVIQGITGGSLGKLALGLRVVTADGQRCGIGRSFLRTMLWIVDAITCALPILGGILMLSTKGHRRVGDMVAKTFVVAKEQEGHPVVVPGLTAPAAWPGATQPGYPGYQPQAPGGWPAGPAGPAGPAAPGGWPSPPTTGQTGTWAPSGTGAPPVQSPAPTEDGPTWDAAREAYIQYDRAQGAWVQWNDDAKQWRPIDE